MLIYNLFQFKLKLSGLGHWGAAKIYTLENTIGALFSFRSTIVSFQLKRNFPEEYKCYGYKFRFSRYVGIRQYQIKQIKKLNETNLQLSHYFFRKSAEVRVKLLRSRWRNFYCVDVAWYKPILQQFCRVMKIMLKKKACVYSHIRVLLIRSIRYDTLSLAACNSITKTWIKTRLDMISYVILVSNAHYAVIVVDTLKSV